MENLFEGGTQECKSVAQTWVGVTSRRPVSRHVCLPQLPQELADPGFLTVETGGCLDNWVGVA